MAIGIAIGVGTVAGIFLGLAIYMMQIELEQVEMP